MSPVLRIILWLFGSLFWTFWMYLAYQADFLGMLSDGDTKKPYFLRFLCTLLPIDRTPKNKKRIFLGLVIFGVAVISCLCFLTE